MKAIIAVTRGLLTGFLIICIYKETGWATAVFALFVSAKIELENYKK